MCDYEYIGFFCKRLADLRIQKNISARELSLSLGFSESYINKVENGKAFPSLEAFFAICEYLNISPHEFFDNETAYPVLIKIAVHEMNKLSENQLKRMIALMKDINKSDPL